MSRRTNRGNRYGLGLAGLALTAGGGYVVARGVGAFGSGRKHTALLTGVERDYASGHGWFWYAVAAVAVVAAVWALRWLLVQARSDRLDGLQLEPDRARGHTRLSSGAITDAVATEIGTYPGVERVRAQLLDKPSRPRLRVTVGTTDDADLGRIRDRIQDEAVPHIRTALDRDDMTVLLLLR